MNAKTAKFLKVIATVVTLLLLTGLCEAVFNYWDGGGFAASSITGVAVSVFAIASVFFTLIYFLYLLWKQL